MDSKIQPGLGELLRYVGELVDQGAETRYRDLNLKYRARYTPVMRALAVGAETVTDVMATCFLTQGAVSQTVGLMKKDGLIGHHGLKDGRKNGIHLTRKGIALLAQLEPQWEFTFAVIDQLEAELGFPVLATLQNLARSLESTPFAERLRDEELRLKAKGSRRGK